MNNRRIRYFKSRLEEIRLIPDPIEQLKACAALKDEIQPVIAGTRKGIEVFSRLKQQLEEVVDD